MSPTFVQDAVSRSNRNRLFLSVFIILVMVAGLVVMNRYWLNFIKGPADITKQAVLAATNSTSLNQYWVNVKGDKAAAAVFRYVETNTDTGSKTVQASYMALTLSDRLLLVKIPGDNRPTTTKFTGEVTDLTSEEQDQVIKMEKENDLAGVFLPFKLDTEDFRQNGYIALGVGGLVLLICLYGIFSALGRMANPTGHPIMKALKRFGDPEQIAEQINQEMSNPHQTIGKVHLSTNWLVMPKAASGLAAARLEDIMWAYGKVTQHRTNGIPTGKSYAALIVDRYGKILTVTGKEQAMNDTLKAVYQHAPWVIMGYNQQVVAGWKSSRASVIAAVDQRRQQLKGPTQASTVEQSTYSGSRIT